MRCWLAGAWLVVSVACVDEATQVLVWVDIPEASSMRARATKIRVQVFDQDAVLVHEDERRLTGDAPFLTPPVSISVVPIGGDATRRFRVEIALVERDMDTDVEFAHQTAESSFVPGELREIWVRFEDACLGVPCERGRTCVEGTCRRACFEAAVPGTTTRSDPAACPCQCGCAGDVCEDGQCTSTRPVSQVAGGFSHACAIADGSLLCWGNNADGQLGLGDTIRRDRPTDVPLAARAAALDLGAQHTCVILEDQTLWCWGDNTHLALGFDGDDSLSPRQVVVPGSPPIDRFSFVGASLRHTCATTASGGRIFCWGDNGCGQGGAPDVSVQPEECAVEGVCPAASCGELPRPLMPHEVRPGSSGDGGFAEIYAGSHHTCARQRDARLWCWGSNGGGVLGRELPFSSLCANPEPAMVTTFPEGVSVRAAANGGWHMIAIGDDGQVYTWGDDSEGRLGVAPGVTDNRTPSALMPGVAAAGGLRHTCVIGGDTSLFCFGTNAAGEVGIGSDADNLEAPARLFDDGWVGVGLGTNFSCGIREGGALYCWGGHSDCRLGIGEPCSQGAREVERSIPTRVCVQ